MKKGFLGLFIMIIFVLFVSINDASANVPAPFEGGYIGLNIGPTDIDLCGAFSRCNDSDTGFKIYGGLDIDKTFAAEASYFNLGSAGYTGWWGKYKFDVTGLAIDGLAKLPVGKNADVFAKLGLTLWGKNSFLFASGGGLDIKAGVGARFGLTDVLSLRVEYEHYDLGGTDASMTSVGLVLGF